jgi:hypothetical protein
MSSESAPFLGPSALLKRLRRLSCVRPRRQAPNTPTPALTDYEKFLFCAGASAATGLLAATVYPSIAGLSTACVPLLVQVEPPLAALDPRVLAALPDSPKTAAAKLTTVSGIQGSLAFTELVLADPWSGASHLALASFGIFVARPEGLGLLPTFSLVAALNSAVGILKASLLLSKKSISVGFAHGLIPNYLNFITLAHPCLYGLACFFSWRLLAGLRDAFVPSGDLPLDAPAAVHASPAFTPFAGQGRLAGTTDEAHTSGTAAT